MPVTSFGQVISPLGQGVGFPGTVSRMGSHRAIKARQVLASTANPISFGAPVMLIPDGYGGTWQSIADFIAGEPTAQTTHTASTVNTSPTVTITDNSLAGITVGCTVTGTGIPGSTTVIAVTYLNGIPTITLSANATATGTPTLTFIQAGGSLSAAGLVYGGVGGVISAPRFAGIAVREVRTTLTFPINVTPGASPVLGSYAQGEICEVLEDGSITVTITAGVPIAGNPVYTRLVANGAVAGTAVGDLEAGPLATSDVVSTTATLVAGTAAFTVASGTGIVVGMAASGGSIPQGAAVVAVSGTTITVSAAPTAAGAAGTPVSFSNLMALPDVSFETGFIDANGIAEITIQNRRAA